MSDVIVILSGCVAGIVMWLPCGIGLAGHRHITAGLFPTSGNRLVIIGSAAPKTYSSAGKVLFAVIMAVWLVIFFTMPFVPIKTASLLGLPPDAPIIGHALKVLFSMSILCAIAGHYIWKKVAYA